MKTQKEQIKSHLKTYGKISSWRAIKAYHITRLSHYILTLRKEGWNIESVWKVEDGTKWTEYQLKSKPS